MSIRGLIGWYDPEASELLMATVSLVFGIWLFVFGDYLFEGRATIAFMVMRSYAASWMWGAISIVQGAFQIWAFRHDTIPARRWASGTGVVIWLMILGTIAAAEWRLAEVVFVSMFVLTNAWVFLRLGWALRASNSAPWPRT